MSCNPRWRGPGPRIILCYIIVMIIMCTSRGPGGCHRFFELHFICIVDVHCTRTVIITRHTNDHGRSTLHSCLSRFPERISHQWKNHVQSFQRIDVGRLAGWPRQSSDDVSVLRTTRYLTSLQTSCVPNT